jgi:hypothetical protein
MTSKVKHLSVCHQLATKRKRDARTTYFGDACSAAWYSGFL